MQAITYSTYGAPDVVVVTDVPLPKIKPNQVLIKVHAASVSSGDWRARSLNLPKGFGMIGRLMFGLFGPRQPILGSELSGVIEAVGTSVSNFKIGDEVFAFPDVKMGAHAEYRAMDAGGMIVRKPNNLSFVEAAALCFGGTAALSFLRDKCGIKAGDKVLIIGASGATGSAAVQIAKYFGADVTGVCSTANLELVSSLGADQVIDYKHEDFTQNGEKYDIILNCSADVRFSDVEGSLKDGGRLALILGNFKQLLGLERAPNGSGKKLISGVAQSKLSDLELLADLAENGQFRPVIDATFPLAHAKQAHARVDTGHKRGNVVLTMAHDVSGGISSPKEWHPFT